MKGQIIIFDLQGKVGHFRKFYTNSSSLSYFFPPKTATIGIVASILGKSRDSYYDLFNTEHHKVTISIKAPLKKHIECINYLNYKSGGHTQIHLELLLPLKTLLKYRIYFWTDDKKVAQKLTDNLIKKTFPFGLYLGQRQFIATARFIASIDEKDIHEKSGKAMLSTVSPLKNFVGIPSLGKEPTLEYTRERMPVAFRQNGGITREILISEDFICETTQSKIYGEFHKFYDIDYSFNGNKINDSVVFY